MKLPFAVSFSVLFYMYIYMKVLGGLKRRIFLMKSLELKCHAYFLDYLCYKIPTHGTHIYSLACILWKI